MVSHIVWMEWIFVAFLYIAAALMAAYKFGSPGFIGAVTFLSVHSAGIRYAWSTNHLVSVFIAGFAAFMVTIMIPHWYLLATGRPGIIGRKSLSDEDF